MENLVIWIRIEGVVAVKVEVGLAAIQIRRSNFGDEVSLTIDIFEVFFLTAYLLLNFKQGQRNGGQMSVGGSAASTIHKPNFGELDFSIGKLGVEIWRHGVPSSLLS